MSKIFADTVYRGLKLLYPSEKFPVIVPVPPRPGKIRKKGWDQIQELCGFLRHFYGISVQKLLYRLSKNQQKKLDRRHRLENSGKSFGLREKYCQKLAKKSCFPQEIVLLDDVLTTGATVEACSKVLKEAGIKKVSILTIFIVD